VTATPQGRFMGSLPASPPARWAILGAGLAGIFGAIVGLIVGLFVYVPTAVFAMVELGLPATILGGSGGLLLGSVVAVSRRISRNWQRTPSVGHPDPSRH